MLDAGAIEEKTSDTALAPLRELNSMFHDFLLIATFPVASPTISVPTLSWVRQDYPLTNKENITLLFLFETPLCCIASGQNHTSGFHFKMKV